MKMNSFCLMLFKNNLRFVTGLRLPRFHNVFWISKHMYIYRHVNIYCFHFVNVINPCLRVCSFSDCWKKSQIIPINVRVTIYLSSFRWISQQSLLVNFQRKLKLKNCSQTTLMVRFNGTDILFCSKYKRNSHQGSLSSFFPNYVSK